jgi:adenylylsulfate kinase-like enzyme
MANINVTTKKSLNRVQLMKENNTNLEYLYIDNIRVGCMGSVNEKDREAGLAVIQRIVDNSDKTGMALVMEVMAQVQFEANMNEKEVNPDEILEVTVEGIKFPCVLSYEKKALYDEAGDEICNASDIDCDLNERALKAILEARAINALKEDMEKDD